MAFPKSLIVDQGCQFTSNAWIESLQQHGIHVSMDGKGRWADNIYIERLWRTIKYEMIYLHSFHTVAQARDALAYYITFYNTRRYHSKLNYHTPDAVFAKKVIPSRQELFESFITLPTYKPGVIMI
jgi:putative transposase